MHINPLSSIVAAAALLLVLLLLPGTNAAFDPNTAWYALHLSKAAYCSPRRIRSWSCGATCNEAPIKITGVYSPSDLETQGYVGVNDSNKEIVVAFRGSQNDKNMESNINFVKVDYRPDVCKGCAVHQGFKEAYESLSSSVQQDVQALVREHPDYSIFITGHSLGAALATLCAADLAAMYPDKTVRLYSLGSPRVGNAAFADYTGSLLFVNNNEAYRISHGGDPVPHLPPILLGFKHVPSEVYYSKGALHHENPILCDDIGKDEDRKCIRSKLAISFDDHTHMFGTCTDCECDENANAKLLESDKNLPSHMNALLALYNELEQAALDNKIDI